jgi:diadenosine tetraphosphate (Ap4A) HIT family hydrolase
MKQQNIYSHLTAKEREKMSFPMNWLFKRNRINGRTLDYGCGFGTDAELLGQNGVDISKYDKYYFKELPDGTFDTITCIYVLNVIHPIEQTDVLLEVSRLLKPGGKAYFAVRRDIKKEGFRMHYIHKKPTYQTNVRLPYKSVFRNDSCEIYEYQHYNQIDNGNAECVFCAQTNEIILESATAYAVWDKYPVSKGHALIIPKIHKANFFDLSIEQQFALTIIVNKMKVIIDKLYNPSGYNIGVNINESAGQTINHVHMHLIPRYDGDVDNPIGGVRNVIAEKGDYTKPL